MSKNSSAEVSRVTRSATKKAAAEVKQSKDSKNSKESKESEHPEQKVCDQCCVQSCNPLNLRSLPKKERPIHAECRKCNRHYWYTIADNEIEYPNEVVGEDICYACVAVRKLLPLLSKSSFLGTFL
jgi:hypothetical protein